MNELPEIPAEHRKWTNPLPPELQDVQWDSIPKELAKTLTPFVFGKEKRNLYLFGFAGRGKTHSAACMALAAWKAGRRVTWWDVPTLLKNISDCRTGSGFIEYRAHGRDYETSERIMLQAIYESDLVVLDDIGSRVSEAQESMLLNVVNQRTGKQLVTTGNWSLLELAKRIDHRICSRIGSGLRIGLTGQDRRLTNAETINFNIDTVA